MFIVLLAHVIVAASYSYSPYGQDQFLNFNLVFQANHTFVLVTAVNRSRCCHSEHGCSVVAAVKVCSGGVIAKGNETNTVRLDPMVQSQHRSQIMTNLVVVFRFLHPLRCGTVIPGQQMHLAVNVLDT